MGQNCLMKARIIGGRLDGEEVLIPRIKFRASGTGSYVHFKQFPVKLAFAMRFDWAYSRRETDSLAYFD